jgi:hypothetical protein
MSALAHSTRGRRDAGWGLSGETERSIDPFPLFQVDIDADPNMTVSYSPWKKGRDN